MVLAANAVLPGLIAARTPAPHAVRTVAIEVPVGTKSIHESHGGTLAGDGHAAPLERLDHGLLLARAVPKTIHVDLHELIVVQDSLHHLLNVGHNQASAIKGFGSLENALEAAL